MLSRKLCFTCLWSLSPLTTGTPPPYYQEQGSTWEMLTSRHPTTATTSGGGSNTSWLCPETQREDASRTSRFPNKPEQVAKVLDDPSYVSSEDDNDLPLDINRPSELPDNHNLFKPQLIHNHHTQSIPESLQQYHGLATLSSGPWHQQPGTTTPLSLQCPLDKSMGDKILQGKYLEFALLLPNSLTRPQAPEFQVSFQWLGPRLLFSYDHGLQT